MKITIRNADIMDSGPISELSGQLGYPSDDIATRKRLDKILKKDDHCVLVAENGDRVVGWIHGFYSHRVESDPFVEIGGLVIDKNYRKRGAGKILVQRIEKWAESISCVKIRVRTSTSRKETHVFYETLGFDLVKEQKIFDKKFRRLR